MKTLAEKLKNETQVPIIFSTIQARSEELGKMYDPEASSLMAYEDFSVEELEDLTFIRTFERHMTVISFCLGWTISGSTAEEDITRRIDDAREAKGLSSEMIAARANTWQSDLPCALSYLIKTGKEIRRSLRYPAQAVAS